MIIPRVKGTHDYLDLRFYHYVVQTVTKHLKHYNYSEIKTPIIEHTDLYKRSLGQHTDVVTKEMFLLQSAKENESLCLRPEATAPAMRAYLENRIAAKPWKVFSVGPMFRHERPQKGRFRQFHQINIEVINAPSIATDVSLITMLDRLFSEQLKLDNYALLINFLGTQEDRALFKEKLHAYLNTIQENLCATCITRKEKNILRIFDCKNEQCQALYDNAPKITDHLSTQSEQEWEQVQNQLHMLSVSYSIDPKLVRGLDYYDKTAFEFVSNNLGSQNTFCGGGRYNRLAQELGAREDIPSIGAAMGIERIMLLLEDKKEDLLPTQNALYVILPLDEEQHMIALLLADTLRAHGLTTDVLFGGSLKNRMKRSNNMGARSVLMIGSDEQKENSVLVKNMLTGTEELIKQINVVPYLKK